MFKNYFKIALRNLFHNKFYSSINILGLAIGIACFLIIGLWVKDELSYEKHFKNSERIYRMASELVTSGEPSTMACTEPIIADQLTADYPEVEKATRMFNLSSLITYNGKDVYEENTFFADSNFFSVFDYEFVKGSPANALHNKEAVVLTEKMAYKIFGNEDPMGKTVMVNNYKARDTARPRIVTGIIKDLNKKSHFNPEVIFAKFRKREMFEYVYVMLRKDYTPEQFKANIWPTLFEYWKKDYSVDHQYLTLNLQPIESIHLDSDLNFEIEPGGNRIHVYVFSIIGLFILLIASINYMNLATARSYNRAKEVGMRKVLGSSKKQLILQFLTESLTLTLLALLFALAFAEIILPVFNDFSEKNLSLNLLDPLTISAVLLLAIFIGLISGTYPAFFISSFMPIKALKGATDNKQNKFSLRKGLVVIQFSLSIIMIIATMVVSSQLDFVKTRELGFNKDQVLLIEMIDPALKKKIPVIKEELLKNPDILKIAGSRVIPGNGLNRNDFDFERPNGTMQPALIASMGVDYDYIDLMEIKILKGKPFDKDMLSLLDSTLFIIVNEAAVKSFGWKDPIGMRVHTPASQGKQRKGTCIAVVKDFHTTSLHETISPMVFHLGRRNFDWLSIKINGKNIPKTISYIENKLKTMSSGYPFKFSFLDDNFNKQYKEEEKRNTLFRWFAGLCIFISCLGLMGLASFATQQRTKEIGVRKISGAEVKDIVYLLSKDFIYLVLIAFVIAVPIANYTMNKWLENFAYHTTIGVGVFIWSGLIAMLIALFTISFHTIKAANKDLTEVLKHE